ncbi:MAG: AraC family transcriptional regulator [Sideroxyarcus sp.]
MLSDDPSERILWLHPENCGGWEFLIVHQSNHLWCVFHEDYTISTSPAFGQNWKYRSRDHTGTGPGTMLMEPGELHRTISAPPNACFKVAIIPRREVEAAAEDLGISGIPHFYEAQTSDPGLANAVWRLGLAVEGNVSDPLVINSMQMEIVLQLLEHTERTPHSFGRAQDHRAIIRAKSYLYEKFYTPVTLDELSKVAGLSRFRLVHAFTRTVGLSPHAYQIQIRMERARQLLRQGMLGAQVAAALGFADQSHFIRHFKRIMGVVPREYNNRARRVYSSSPHSA